MHIFALQKLANKKETSNSDSEELNQSANSIETHENTFQSFQTLDDGESEAVKESKETKHGVKILHWFYSVRQIGSKCYSENSLR